METHPSEEEEFMEEVVEVNESDSYSEPERYSQSAHYISAIKLRTSLKDCLLSIFIWLAVLSFMQVFISLRAKLGNLAKCQWTKNANWEEVESDRKSHLEARLGLMKRIIIEWTWLPTEVSVWA